MPRAFVFPARVCCSCLSEEAQQRIEIPSRRKLSGFWLFFSTYRYLRVEAPYCDDCAARIRRRESAGTVVMLSGVAIALLVGWRAHLAGGATFLLALIAALPGALLHYRAPHGARISNFSENRVTFAFRSAEYGQRFQLLNSGAEAKK